MTDPSPILAFGEYELDFERGELRCDGSRSGIQRKPLQLLLYLARHRDRVVSKDELLDHVWPDVHVSEDALSSALRHIRRVLGDKGRSPHFIENLRGHGYRFIAAGQQRFQTTPLDLPSTDSPFVGRQTILGRLEAALDSSTKGRGRVVLLAGEPGIGKTRTAEEFARCARAQGVAVYTGWCDESGIAPPYWPWVRLLRAMVEDTSADSLRADLGPGAVTLSRVLPELRERWPDLPTPPDLGPDELRFQLSDAICTVLRRLAARQPGVLIVDDLHRADEPSLDVLRFVAHEIGRVPILVLGTYRDVEVGPGHPLTETLADLARQEAFERIPLEGFSLDEADELVRRLADREVRPEFVEAIVGMTDGNPLFVTELIRALPTADAADESDASALEVPLGLREVILGRLAQLSPTCHEALALASVMGRDFVSEVIEAASHLSADAVDDAIDEAGKAGVLGHGPQGAPRFAHVLTRDAVYGEIRRGRRAELHRAVAEAIAKIASPNELNEQAARIAGHWEEAGEPLAAARWHRRAARWMRFTDVAQELRHWSRVLDLVEGLPDAEAADLGLKACTALMRKTTSQAASLLRQGRQLAERSTDPQGLLPRLLLRYGAARMTAGETSEGLEAMREAEALTGDLVDPSLGLEIDQHIGLALLSLGRLTESAEVLERIVAEESTEFEWTWAGSPVNVTAGSILAWTLFEGGKLVESADALATTRRLASGLKLGVFAEATIMMTECRVVAHQGDLERGLRMAREMVELAQRSHNVDPVWVLVMGEIQGLCGQWQEASAAFESSLTIARESGLSLNLEARILVHLARAQLGLGQASQAIATAEEALAVARTRGARHHEAYAHIVHADALLATTGIERLDEIEQAHSHAEQLIAETEAALIAPNLCESRAELARLRGDDPGCEREFRKGHRLYTEMGAVGHAERVARELRL